jgi:hypothetical protein
MKKGSSSQQNPKRVVKANHTKGSMTIGMDLGDKNSCYCVLARSCAKRARLRQRKQWVKHLAE